MSLEMMWFWMTGDCWLLHRKSMPMTSSTVSADFIILVWIDKFRNIQLLRELNLFARNHKLKLLKKERTKSGLLFKESWLWWWCSSLWIIFCDDIVVCSTWSLHKSVASVSADLITLVWIDKVVSHQYYFQLKEWRNLIQLLVNVNWNC